LGRVEQALARLRKVRALTADRDWVRNRRARTRRLIEYGGLVVKAGLAELLADDRATMLGGFLSLRDQLAGFGDDRSAEPVDPAIIKQRWRRRGLRTFDADADAVKEQAGDAGRVSTDMTIATPAEGTGGRRQ
jgi:hypothetical protein